MRLEWLAARLDWVVRKLGVEVGKYALGPVCATVWRAERGYPRAGRREVCELRRVLQIVCFAMGFGEESWLYFTTP